MNNRKIMIYICTILCLIMPIVSIEGLIPWILCLFIMHKNLKIYKDKGSFKRIAANLFICMLLMIFYNVAGIIIQDILVKLWV